MERRDSYVWVDGDKMPGRCLIRLNAPWQTQRLTSGTQLPEEGIRRLTFVAMGVLRSLFDVVGAF